MSARADLRRGVCDSADDYSSDTSTIGAGAQVVEFDVVTATSDDEEYLYVADSSSGSDNFIVDHLVVREIKSAKPLSSSSSSTSSTSNSYEESDEERDSELKPADYWTCIKCKNKQNNPLYRYCEKCYQLRKNYFPPRPRHAKSRPRKKRKTYGTGHHLLGPASSDDLSSSDADEDDHFFGPSTAKRPRIANGSSTQVVVSSAAPPTQSAVGTENSDCNVIREGGGESRRPPAGFVMLKNGHFEDSRARSTAASANQLTTTDEDEPDENVFVEETSQEQPRLELGKLNGQEAAAAAAVVATDERPKTLKLMNVDSGFSSSSSGQESIPSQAQTPPGEEDKSVLQATKSLLEEYEERKEEDRRNNLCIICVNEPKDSAFVHALSLHICCCYKCAVKVWNRKKRCPICNCKVKNVLKCYVH